MAIISTTVWEVRTAGSDLNGGGFDSAAAGTDRSQQDSPFVTIDGATITATVHSTTTQLNIVGFTVSAADVGNHVNIQGGTMTAGVFRITAVDVPNNRWTIDRSGGTAAQTGTGRMGGAFATPGMAFSVAVGLNDVHLKSGTYTLTTTSNNVAGGRITLPLGNAQDLTRLLGYGSTRLDNGAKPVIKAGVGQTGFTIITPGQSTEIRNVEVDGSSNTSVNGIVSSSSAVKIIRCRARSCPGTGIQIAGSGSQAAFFCEAVSCGVGFSIAANTFAYGCEAHGCTIRGIDVSSGHAISCLSYNNTGGTTDGFGSGGSSSATFINCTSYGNGRYGFYIPTVGAPASIINCIAVNNGAFGFASDASNNTVIHLINCAGYNNTSGNYSATQVGTVEGFIVLTGDPFTAAGSGDFSLNNTAGAGASARGAGLPAAWPAGTTTGYPDLGAVQHQDSGGGGGGGGGGTSGHGIPTIPRIRR